MRDRKAAAVIVWIALTAVLLSGCGRSPADSADSGADRSELTETAETWDAGTDPKEESEGAEEAKSEETDADKVEVLNEQNVSVCIGSGKTGDGLAEFTVYFSNTGSEKRIVFGEALMINGEEAVDPVVESHDANSYSTSSSLFAYLDGGEDVWSVVTIQAEGVRPGDAAQIDFKLEIEDDDDNTLATVIVEFGTGADGEVLLGEDLAALGLAPSMIVDAETFPETVFFDQNGVKVTGEGFTFNAERERVIHLTIANNTSSDIELWPNNAIVDGYVVYLNGGNVDVPAGETVSAEFGFNEMELALTGITSIHDISMSWYIRGDELDNSSDPTDMVSAVTDAESVMKERDTSLFVELYNADGIRVSAEPESHKDRWDDNRLDILFENDTEELLATNTILHLAGGGTRDSSDKLYPHSKHWEEITVHEGDTYYVRVSKANDGHIMEKIVETEETEVMIP